MIDIRPLTHISEEDIQRVTGPYTCVETYKIRYSDTPERTSFEMELAPLAEPFTGRYAHIDTAEMERYTSMLAGGFSFGAFDRDRLVGLIIAEKMHWNNSLSVWEFHVASDLRGQGIGRRMMQAVVEQARKAGVRIITCETQNQNATAIQVYRALGFRPESIDLSLYSNDDFPDRGIAVFMKLRL